jgi:hypothetical protein
MFFISETVNDTFPEAGHYYSIENNEKLSDCYVCYNIPPPMASLLDESEVELYQTNDNEYLSESDQPEPPKQMTCLDKFIRVIAIITFCSFVLMCGALIRTMYIDGQNSSYQGTNLQVKSWDIVGTYYGRVNMTFNTSDVHSCSPITLGLVFSSHHDAEEYMRKNYRIGTVISGWFEEDTHDCYLDSPLYYSFTTDVARTIGVCACIVGLIIVALAAIIRFFLKA